MTKKSFTDVLRQAVLDAPLTRYAISKRTGIEQSALSRFVHGERGISSDVLDRLAELLGWSLNTPPPDKLPAKKTPSKKATNAKVKKIAKTKPPQRTQQRSRKHG